MLNGRPWYSALYVQVLFAVVLGAVVGWIFPSFATNPWVEFLGRGFVKLVKMAIAPIIFCTVVSGIAHIDEAKSVGRVGVKALIYFECVSTLALVIGILVGVLWRPGESFPGEGTDARTGGSGQMLRGHREPDEAGRLYPAHHSRQRRRRLRQQPRGRPLPGRRAGGLPDRRCPASPVLRGAVRLRAVEPRPARGDAAQLHRRFRPCDVRGHRHHHAGGAARRLRRDGVHDRQVRPLGPRQPPEPDPHLLRHGGAVRVRGSGSDRPPGAAFRSCASSATSRTNC